LKINFGHVQFVRLPFASVPEADRLVACRFGSIPGVLLSMFRSLLRVALALASISIPPASATADDEQVITTLVGDLDRPLGLAVDAAGLVYVADRGNHRVLRIDPATGKAVPVAGTGSRGFAGDGGVAEQAQLSHPFDVTVDPTGTLIIADTGNHRVRSVDQASGIITTLAGTGEQGLGG
jgi:DNA-binding beta-propeller fold protein YncE